MGEAALDLYYEPNLDDLEYKGERGVDLKYTPAPTIERFHASEDSFKALVGPVGSGKSTAAAWEIIYYIPQMLYARYGIKKTRWLVLRNTYAELIDTTMKTIFEWFDPAHFGHYHKQEKRYEIVINQCEIELLFRSCDRPEDVKKFKSLEITGYWIDESCEVPNQIKLMLKTRVGRYPRAQEWPDGKARRFGVETTNPPDIESRDYQDYHSPERLADHMGFWQRPGENIENLREGYYDDLRKDFANDEEWIERYIEGKPGVMKVGKDVYPQFSHTFHVAKEALIWPGKAFTIYRGWDNTGNRPAAVAGYVPSAGVIHILREFWDDRSGIIDFAERVKRECNAIYPDASFVDWGDPAGETKFSRQAGGLTSNALMMKEIGIAVRPSVTNDFDPRRESVDKMLRSQHRGRPDLLIDPGCNRLIQGFMGGYGYREVQPGIYSEKPLKNRFSHVHDALQYLILKLGGFHVKQHNKKKKPQSRGSGYGG